MDSMDKPEVVGPVEQMRVSWRRVAEFSLIPTLILAIRQSYVGWTGLEGLAKRLTHPSALENLLHYDGLELMTLAAWTICPIVLRPLSSGQIPAQKRFAVCCLVLAAGGLWFALGSWGHLGMGGIRETLLEDYLEDQTPSPPLMLLVPALVAVAGYLRLGWAKERSSGERSGA